MKNLAPTLAATTTRFAPLGCAGLLAIVLAGCGTGASISIGDARLEIAAPSANRGAPADGKFFTIPEGGTDADEKPLMRVAAHPEFEGTVPVFTTPQGDLDEAARVLQEALDWAAETARRTGFEVSIESHDDPGRMGCGTVYFDDPDTGDQEKVEYEVYRPFLLVSGQERVDVSYIRVIEKKFFLPANVAFGAAGKSYVLDVDGRLNDVSRAAFVVERENGEAIDLAIAPK